MSDKGKGEKLGDSFKGKGMVTSGGHYRLKYDPPKDPDMPGGSSLVIDRKTGRTYQDSPNHKHFSGPGDNKKR